MEPRRGPGNHDRYPATRKGNNNLKPKKASSEWGGMYLPHQHYQWEKLGGSGCVPEEILDYIAPLFRAPVDIKKKKGSDNELGPPLTTSERHHRDELIMACMYGPEMLFHQNGWRVSTEEKLG
ncbi:hypothetical protein H5410_030812 [Solanum commersonii]|uniref:Uncharacterized protein n=1 Tax=Solanum commersonii TaxID=4109 RepID=A0A9J5YGN2_SOLCO|nr:hypothetical protein H5410_030812 [Solanum commersonii]